MNARIPSGDNTASVNNDDYVVGPQAWVRHKILGLLGFSRTFKFYIICSILILIKTLTLNLWSDRPNTNLVYGLKEHSMRLSQDNTEAINVHHMNVLEKFCYAQVQLKSVDEEQEEFQSKCLYFSVSTDVQNFIWTDYNLRTQTVRRYGRPGMVWFGQEFSYYLHHSRSY